MTKLAVVTLTSRQRPKWFEQCRQSVLEALPENAEHVVVFCPRPSMVESARWESLSLADYVAFVDDDDLVINNSLNKLLFALETTNCGIAFTDEQRIDETGNIVCLEPVRKRVSYNDVAISVLGCHHLAMLKTAAVPKHLWQVALEFGGGIEWLIKASTALTNGAVRLPMQGYQWRQHSKALHLTEAWKTPFVKALPQVHRFLKSYQPTQQEIPVFDLSRNVYEMEASKCQIR